MAVVRFRDGSLVVPARVSSGDGSVGDGVKRIDRRHPLYDGWSSYCERHPEDVVERRRRLEETGEDLAEGLAAACCGLLFIGALAAIESLKELGGVELSTAVMLGGVCGSAASSAGSSTAGGCETVFMDSILEPVDMPRWLRGRRRRARQDKLSGDQ